MKRNCLLSKLLLHIMISIFTVSGQNNARIGWVFVGRKAATGLVLFAAMMNYTTVRVSKCTAIFSDFIVFQQLFVNPLLNVLFQLKNVFFFLVPTVECLTFKE